MTLATPLRLGPVRLRNRVVAAPMERNYCDERGRPTAHYADRVAAVAHGGAALVYAEAAFVRADGRVRPRQLAAHDDACIPGLRALADAAHAGGALFGMQVVHGGRLSRSAVSGHLCVAPSPVTAEVVDGDLPHELDRAGIADLVTRFADAARRSVCAGADVVSVHAAHGYLLSQFLSPRTNQRTDEYADPARFLGEVLAAVRAAAPGACVGLRVSAHEGLPDGLDTDRTVAVLDRAGAGSLDFVDVSAGCYEAGHLITPPGELPRGLHAAAAARFRRLGPPVGVAGRIVDGADAERVLASGDADFVTVGRALHADPTWTDAVLSGRAPRPCISCNYCADALRTGEPVGCAVNPAAAASLPPVGRGTGSRRVLVVGAGPAGLEAAHRLSGAGHRVRLVEREDAPGGLLRLAARLEHKTEYRRIVDWYTERLAASGVDVQCGVEVDAERIAAAAENVVVLATGARRTIPDGPGVHELTDWLRREAHRPLADDHVLWGLDRNAAALADHLAARGSRVVLVGAADRLAHDCGPRSTVLTLARLGESPHVRVLPGTDVQAVDEGGLRIRDASGVRRLDRCGPLIVSVDDEPDTALPAAVAALAPDKTVLTVGGTAGHGRWAATAIRHAAQAVSPLAGTEPRTEPAGTELVRTDRSTP